MTSGHSQHEAEADAFRARLSGTFQGVMRWEGLDALWARLRPGRWFVYQTDLAPPAEPLKGDVLAARLAEIDAELRREHAYDYCGIVYADDPEAPTLVKVYDPANLGTSCSHGDAPIPPKWILSTARPASIEREAPAPAFRWRLWRARSR
jgi:hypothetical protein